MPLPCDLQLTPPCVHPVTVRVCVGVDQARKSEVTAQYETVTNDSGGISQKL